MRPRWRIPYCRNSSRNSRLRFPGYFMVLEVPEAPDTEGRPAAFGPAGFGGRPFSVP